MAFAELWLLEPQFLSLGPLALGTATTKFFLSGLPLEGLFVCSCWEGSACDVCAIPQSSIRP